MFRGCRSVNQQVLDTVVPVLVAVGIVLAADSNYGTTAAPLDTLSVTLTLTTTLPLILHRRLPVTVLVVSLASALAFEVFGHWAPLNNYGPLFGLYSVAARRPRRVSAWWVVPVAAVLVTGSIAAQAGPVWLLVLLAGLFAVSAWAMGDVRRMLTERNTQLAVMTEQLHRDREALAQQAVTNERLRVARELHDVVAHHMAVISVQAGLAHYVVSTEPAVAAASLRTIADASGEALEEMRRMLDLLRTAREQDDLTAPAPGLAQLGDLLHRMRAAGMPIELVEVGTATPLPPGMSLCAYRIIQEALTNVLKHAGNARTTVELRYEDGLIVRVHNEQGTPGPGPASSNGGQGIAGMRERVQLYGGTLTAGALDGGGFEIVMRLPSPRR